MSFGTDSVSAMPLDRHAITSSEWPFATSSFSPSKDMFRKGTQGGVSVFFATGAIACGGTGFCGCVGAQLVKSTPCKKASISQHGLEEKRCFFVDACMMLPIFFFWFDRKSDPCFFFSLFFLQWFTHKCKIWHDERHAAVLFPACMVVRWVLVVNEGGKAIW